MSNMNTSGYAADQHGRPDTSKVSGTGIATGPGTLGGVHASELGSDRSGTKTEDFTSGVEGTQAAHPISNTTETSSGHHHPHTSLGGHDHAQSRGATTSSGSVNPSTTGTSSNNSNRDDTLNRGQHGRSGEGLSGATGVSSVGGHHKHGSDTLGQHDGHASRSSAGGTTSHGLAGGLGGATATPQQQTMAGHKDASVVAASQPTTYETGSMLDVGDVPVQSAHQTSSHQPTHAAGQTHTDSARAGDNAYSSTGGDAIGRDAAGRGHTGRDATGMAAAGAAAAYAAHHHDQQSYGSNPSVSRPVASGIDPAHSDARARDTAHSTGGPLHSHHQNQFDSPGGINQSTPAPGQSSRLDNTHSSHAGHTSRDTALGAGAAAGAAAYGAHEHNKHKDNTGLDTSSSRPEGSTRIDPAHTDSRSVAGSGHHGPLSGRDHTSRDAALSAGAATGAAGYGAHEHHKHHEQGSSASHPVGSHIDPTHADSRTSVGTDQLGSQSGHGGHTSRDAALGAGAVGGAAAYGAHEHNKHKDRDTVASGPAGSRSNPVPNNPRYVAGNELRDPQSSHGNPSTADTALAGAGAAGAGYGTSRLARHHNEPSIGQSGDGLSGVGSNATNLSSQTSPSHGQYNTLSGGTPSGIVAGSHAGTSTGPQTFHGTSDSSGYTGNSQVGSGSGPYSSLTSGTPSGIATGDHHSRDTHTAGIGHDSDISHSGLKGSAAAAAEQLRSTGRVTHKCQNCNEDMDISKHFTRNH